MNQYLFLRRMRGPIMLLVFGVTAILDEYTGIRYSMSWPLYIIAWGILKLAENAVLAQNPPPPPGAYPNPYPGYPPPGAGYGAYPGPTAPPEAQPPTTAIVPVQDEERS
jgi:hypothetical protein